ncbi:uncharacterized protein LOC124357505 isoform X1 [Homalodisca vitripennis]|uniref:uncharacterized protein LOC124357505 isoform X1 n=1 Tax=Homalodisca vitripennis TaxID=197043 RepID=UPI001EEBC486|nr:uncharacterized protein LOC124357505 isoform X1 [Homalodisca vitripennis]
MHNSDVQEIILPASILPSRLYCVCYRMASREAIKEMLDTERQLVEEDKKFSAQLLEMEDEFTVANGLNREGFNQQYSQGVKNFRLDFGVVCEKGHAEVVKKLKEGKDKKRAVDEYLACVECTRQKAAQRAQQSD